MPPSFSDSSLEPTPTQTPRDTDFTEGIRSATTRIPLSRWTFLKEMSFTSVYVSLAKSLDSGRLRKKLHMQGAQILRNEAYFFRYAAMTKDAAQRRRWTFYEAVNDC